MVHDHAFGENSAGTLMLDRFEFESPFGILGKVVDRVFLSRYMRGFIVRRNEALKRLAESDEWHRYIR